MGQRAEDSDWRRNPAIPDRGMESTHPAARRRAVEGDSASSPNECVCRQAIVCLTTRSNNDLHG